MGTHDERTLRADANTTADCRLPTADSARRVVVTGIGAITPIGFGRDGLWQGVRRGVSAVRRITRFDVEQFPCRIAAEVHGFDPHEFMGARRARRLDRFAQFGLAAALLAVEDSRLQVAEQRDATGV